MQRIIKQSILILVVLCQASFINAQTDNFKIADSLAAVGKQRESIKLLEELNPKSERVYLKLAKFQQAQGDNNLALENYKKVLLRNPDRVLTLLDYGELLMENGDLKQADSVFTKLTEES